MRRMIRNINIYEEDYEKLKKMKLVPSEAFNDVINRLLDKLEEEEM